MPNAAPGDTRKQCCSKFTGILVITPHITLGQLLVMIPWLGCLWDGGAKKRRFRVKHAHADLLHGKLFIHKDSQSLGTLFL